MSRLAREWHDGEGGFTLLEVLLSMLLLVLLMSAIYAALGSARTLVQTGLRQARRDEQMIAARQFLRRSLAQARPVAVDVGDGRPSAWLQGGLRQLRFVAPSVAALGGRGLQVQQLQLVPADGERGRLELQLADLPMHGESLHWRRPPEVLLDGISGGHFAYRGADGSAREGHWRETWTAPGRLPRLIGLQLQFRDHRPWSRLEVALRIDPDSMSAPDAFEGGGP